MSDGTTATTLAPSEDEMNKFQHFFGEIFGNMRDTVINASRLASEVGELRKAVEDMKHEVSTLRENARWLDQSLVETREARDRAIAEGRELRLGLSEAQAVARAAQEQIVSLNDSLKRTTDSLEQAKKSWDNAELRVMELEDENKALKAKLAAISAALGNNEPQPAVGQVVEQVPQPRAETGQFLPKTAQEQADEDARHTGQNWSGLLNP